MVSRCEHQTPMCGACWLDRETSKTPVRIDPDLRLKVARLLAAEREAA
jgi:hypothetical protein